MKWSEVAQSCPTLCNPMDCSLPRSSVHGIFKARVLEWVAISSSRGSSWPRDRSWVSRIVSRPFTVWATKEVFWLIGSCKYRVVQYTIYPFSPNGYILWNYRTISAAGNWHWHSSSLVLTCEDLYNHLCKQDTQLFHYHKALPLDTCYNHTHVAYLPHHPSPLASNLSPSLILSFREYCINGIIYNVWSFEIGSPHTPTPPTHTHNSTWCPTVVPVGVSIVCSFLITRRYAVSTPWFGCSLSFHSLNRSKF